MPRLPDLNWPRMRVRPLAIVRHPAEMIALRPEIRPDHVEAWAEWMLAQLRFVTPIRPHDPRLPRELGDRPAVRPEAPRLPVLDEAMIDACLASSAFRELCTALAVEPDPAEEALVRARTAGDKPADGEQSAFLERCLLRRFSARHRWRYPIVRGDAFGRAGHMRQDAYTLIAPDAEAPIGALAMVDLKRFGNLVAQLVHVYSVAARLGVDRIHIPEDHPFLANRQGAQIRLTTDPPAGSNTLTGSFFRRSALIADLTRDEAEQTLAHHVRPMLVPHFAPLRPSRVDLTIHLRAGDVFRKRRVARDYGQPPLAFYLKVLNAVRPAIVRIVYEDLGNPIANILPDRCREMGIAVETQSSSLEADIAALFHADRIVLSRGTFGWAICDLSPHVREIFHFGADQHFRGMLPRARVRSFVDSQGSYDRDILGGNWAYRPEQIAMMIEYPLDAIRERATDPMPGPAT